MNEREASELLDKIRALLRKAVDAGSPEEERRTSALLAAELVHKHKVDLSLGDRMHLIDWQRLAPVRSFAQFPSRCWGCTALISMGQEIWWKPGASWHLGCYREVDPDAHERAERARERRAVEKRSEEEER